MNMKEKQLSSNELLQKAKERSGLSKEVLRQSLHSLLGVISEALDDGKCIVKEHTVTPPPPNNKPVVVPEHQVVRFKSYKNILCYHIKY